MITKTIAAFSRRINRRWDGICVTCGHDYRHGCQGNCTCLSCNGQRQYEEVLAEQYGIVLRGHQAVSPGQEQWQ